VHALKKSRSGAYDKYREEYYSRPASKKAVLKWKRENPEKYRAIIERNRIKGRDNLSDGYIKSCIASNTKGLTFKDITPELIEMKRKQLKLYRDAKENKSKSN
jgi:hypothetical protein